MKNKVCTICLLEKPNSEYEKYSRKCNSCKHVTRCNVCQEVKDNSQYRDNCPNRCKKCDNKRSYNMKRANPTEAFMAKTKRNQERNQERIKALRPKNPRVKFTPEESAHRTKLRKAVHRVFKDWAITKVGKSLEYLAFTPKQFLERFPEIPNGYDIDHKIPLSWFKMSTPISIVFSLDNLQLLPRKENQSKNNHRNDPVSVEYMQLCLPYIREEFISKLV